MSKKKSKKTTRKSNKKLSKEGRIAIILMSIIGIGVMWYLTTLHFAPAGEEAACDLSASLSCATVNESEYSVVLGIPVSILGLVYFSSILLAALFKYNRKTLKTIAFASILFLGPSLYLTTLELTVIKSICIFCEYSKVLMFAMVFAALFELKPQKLGKGHLKEAIIIAIAVAGGVFFVQNVITGDNVPSGKYDEFAHCLSAKRCLMYGSATCQFCAKQRELFGDSIQYVTEIECDPRNPDSESERCIEKNVLHTPTWIIEDENGKTVRKFDPGVQTLETLSEATGCPLPAE